MDVLLAHGSTWANVDGALRLLAEDPVQPVVFGPWRGDAVEELLYWAPFVRWAQSHFALDPARVTVISSGGVGHWYEPCAYLDEQERDLHAPADAARVRPGPVLALAEQYRSGEAAPRPLLKRSQHVPLHTPGTAEAAGLPDGYVVVALAPAPAFPHSDANRSLAESLAKTLSAAGPLVPVDEKATMGAQHALLARATGLVTSWSGLALLGVLSGVPTIALRSEDGEVREPDLDLAARVAAKLGVSLTFLDAGRVPRLADALGNRLV